MRSPGLRFVGHSTVRVEPAGHAVLTDPVLTDRVSALTRVTPSRTAADRADVDLVLLSHLHGDHVHLPSLRLLSEHVRVVVPRLLTDPPHEFATAVTGATRVLVTQPGEDVRLPGAVPELS